MKDSRTKPGTFFVKFALLKISKGTKTTIHSLKSSVYSVKVSLYATPQVREDSTPTPGPNTKQAKTIAGMHTAKLTALIFVALLLAVA